MKLAAARLWIFLLAATLWSDITSALEPSHVVPAIGTIEYAFSPDDDAASVVVRAIDGARSQILVQAFSFTHEGIANALVQASRRGIDVGVIADLDQTELIERTVVRKLAAAGLVVLVDSEHLAAHNKVMVIDADGPRPAVVTGSFNFTFAAQYRNAENLLVMRGNPDLAKSLSRQLDQAPRAFRAFWHGTLTKR